MTYTEMIIDEKVKETRKLTEIELMDLVHETANNFFEYQAEIIVKKVYNGGRNTGINWELEFYDEDIEVCGVTLRQAYEDFYEELLKLVYAEDLADEYEQLEEFERQQIKKYNVENSGVPLGKVV